MDSTAHGVHAPGYRRTLVAGVGNMFRGDDGFGPEVARELALRELPDGVSVTDYGIRAMHLAYDLLEPWDGLILVDLIPARGSPGAVHILQLDSSATPAGLWDPHGMAPHSVLAAVTSLGGALPPTLVVGCEPAELEDRIGLSTAVAAAVEPTIDALLGLLSEQSEQSELPAPAGGR